VTLQRLRDEQGLEAVFEQVCGIAPEGELARMVEARMSEVARFRPA
jgi:hypothetical protein